MTSYLESHADAPASTPDCNLPVGEVITADITATLDFGEKIQESACVNNKGVETSIKLISNESSGITITTEPDLTNSIQLMTGRQEYFMPASSTLCLTPNGNLLFAGYEYTPANNPVIIAAPGTTVVPPVNNRPRWTVGSYRYIAGSASGSSAYSTACLECSGSDNMGSLSMGTSGLDAPNGDYSGSTISIAHALKGPGTYTIINDFSNNLADNLSRKTAKLEVFVGTLGLAGGATLYKATSGKIFVSVDQNGKYHFNTINPLQLTKVVTGSGIPDAPGTMSFTMYNAHNHNPNP